VHVNHSSNHRSVYVCIGKNQATARVLVNNSPGTACIAYRDSYLTVSSDSHKITLSEKLTKTVGKNSFYQRGEIMSSKFIEKAVDDAVDMGKKAGIESMVMGMVSIWIKLRGEVEVKETLSDLLKAMED